MPPGEVIQSKEIAEDSVEKIQLELNRLLSAMGILYSHGRLDYDKKLNVEQMRDDMFSLSSVLRRIYIPGKESSSSKPDGDGLTEEERDLSNPTALNLPGGEQSSDITARPVEEPATEQEKPVSEKEVEEVLESEFIDAPMAVLAALQDASHGAESKGMKHLKALITATVKKGIPVTINIHKDLEIFEEPLLQSFSPIGLKFLLESSSAPTLPLYFDGESTLPNDRHTETISVNVHTPEECNALFSDKIILDLMKKSGNRVYVCPNEA